MENQDLNEQFASFIKTTKDSLNDISRKRSIPLDQLGAKHISTPDVDYGLFRVWQQALSELKQLKDPMPNSLWTIAYKYYRPYFDFTKDERSNTKRIWQQALSDLSKLIEPTGGWESIDPLVDIAIRVFSDDLAMCDTEDEMRTEVLDMCNEDAATLADMLRDEICKTRYKLGGKVYKLFPKAQADNDSIETLCSTLESRLTGNTSLEKTIISNICNLPTNQTDATNILKEKLKLKICNTKYKDKNGDEQPIFTEDEIRDVSIDDISNILGQASEKTDNTIKDDMNDNNAVRNALNNHTYNDLFKALTVFLRTKLKEKFKSKKTDAVFSVTYNEKEEKVSCIHTASMKEVLTITPSIGYDGIEGPLDSLRCDVNVAPLPISSDNPLYDDRSEIEALVDYTYLLHGRGINPGDYGEYTIPEVKGSELPQVAYNAVSDWQNSASAFMIESNALADARRTVGEGNFDDLDAEYSRNKIYNLLANPDDPTNDNTEHYKNRMAELNARASTVAPKMKGSVYTKEDVSNAFNNLHLALNGRTADGHVLTDEERERRDDILNGIEDFPDDFE
jgi:hypothetical protein